MMSATSASMPPPEVYEEEYLYWPWGDLIEKAADWIQTNAPRSAVIMDYMCGTGFLLNQVRIRRPDTVLLGCDINPSFVQYANRTYPMLDVMLQDATHYHPERRPDLIVCTAGLHHLEIASQELFVRKMADELAPGSVLLLGEEFIRHSVHETGRKLAVIEMCTALLNYIISRSAPASVIGAAVDMLSNDLFTQGEFKRSLQDIRGLIEPYFYIEDYYTVWPETGSPFADILLICRKV